MECQGGLLCLPDSLTGTYMVAAVSVTSVGLGIFLLRQLVRGGVCRSKTRLDGKFAIVTGANSGIGKETAKELARRGARVMLACRDPFKAVAAAHDILRETGHTVCVKTLDLADLNSVRKFAAEINQTEPRLDILVNNAGVMGCPKRLTKQGYELHFATNHLGHFLLTFQLKDLMVRSAPARIVNVAAKEYSWGKLKFDDISSENEYTPLGAYAQSKLANILFTRELAKKMKGTEVTVYALHPGVIATDLGRHFEKRVPRLLQLFILPLIYLVKLLTFKTASEGAQTTIFCAVSEDLEGQSGMYYSDCTECKLLPHATNDVAARTLWTLSEEMTGLTQSVGNFPKLKQSKQNDVTDTAMKATEPVKLVDRPPNGKKTTHKIPKILSTRQDADTFEENNNGPRSHVTEPTGLADRSTNMLAQTYQDNFTTVVTSMQESNTPRRRVAESTRRADNSTLCDSPKITMSKQEHYSTCMLRRKQETDHVTEPEPIRSEDNATKTFKATLVLHDSPKVTRSTQEADCFTRTSGRNQETDDHLAESEPIRSKVNSAKTSEDTPVLYNLPKVTRSTQEAPYFINIATQLPETYHLKEPEMTYSADACTTTSGQTSVMRDSPMSISKRKQETDHLAEPELSRSEDNSVKTCETTPVLHDSAEIRRSRHEADYSTSKATRMQETDHCSKRLLITEPVQSADNSAKTCEATHVLHASPKMTRARHDAHLSANVTTSSPGNRHSSRKHVIKPTRSTYYKPPKVWRHTVKDEKHVSRKLHKKEEAELSGSANSLAARETTV